MPPDPSTREGVRDRAMLHLAVCAGLRVSELTGLRLDDVAPQSASIRVRGKGRRERALPLWKTTAAALRAWLAVRGSVRSPELFVNAQGQPFSRWGVAYVLRRHTETADRKCLTLHGKQVSPHVLRNDRAPSNARHPESLPVVGDSNLTTTEVYVRADPTEKLEAIEAVVPPSLRKGKFVVQHALLPSHSPLEKTPHKAGVVGVALMAASKRNPAAQIRF
jgi:integrase/recombinase XerD